MLLCQRDFTDYQLNGECGDGANLVVIPSRLAVLTSCRWVLAYICFYAMILVFAMRASFVMALVCLFPEEPDLEMEEEVQAEARQHHALNNVSLQLIPTYPDNDTGLPSNNSKLIIWDDKTQGFALTAYNYGFLISPVIGGYIAIHSAKYVMMGSMVLSAIATALTPWSVGFSPYMTFVLRAVVGVCGGVCVPAIQELWSKWAPKAERGKLTSFTHSGKMLGNVLSFATTGVLCKFDFLGGWPIAFYATGLLTVIWLGITLYCVYDTPEKHPRITEYEREYILNGLSFTVKKSDKGKVSAPWSKIFTSLPVWACLICKLCSAYGLAVQVTNMPMWIRDVLKIDVEENGLFSALPYIGQFIGSILAGILLDAISRTPCSVTVVRKLTFAVCLLLPGTAILCLAFLGEDHKALAIFLTVVAATTYSAVPVSLRIIIIEIAPKYAGLLMGIMMTIGSIPGIIAPLVTSVITSRGTIDEWDDVFYMCGGFYALAALVFVIFGSAKQQPWAKDSMCKEISVGTNDENIEPEGLENPGFDKDIPLDIIASASDNSSDSGVCVEVSRDNSGMVNKSFGEDSLVGITVIDYERDIHGIAKLDCEQDDLRTNSRKDIEQGAISEIAKKDFEQQDVSELANKGFGQDNPVGITNNDLKQSKSSGTVNNGFEHDHNVSGISCNDLEEGNVSGIAYREVEQDSISGIANECVEKDDVSGTANKNLEQNCILGIATKCFEQDDISEIDSKGNELDHSLESTGCEQDSSAEENTNFEQDTISETAYMGFMEENISAVVNKGYYAMEDSGTDSDISITTKQHVQLNQDSASDCDESDIFSTSPRVTILETVLYEHTGDDLEVSHI